MKRIIALLMGSGLFLSAASCGFIKAERTIVNDMARTVTVTVFDDSSPAVVLLPGGKGTVEIGSDLALIEVDTGVMMPRGWDYYVYDDGTDLRIASLWDAAVAVTGITDGAGDSQATISYDITNIGRNYLSYIKICITTTDSNGSEYDSYIISHYVNVGTTKSFTAVVDKLNHSATVKSASIVIKDYGS